jgi:hypothetical protein
MRGGTEVMCVVNEQFVPEGIEPGTKTTSPNVARVLKPLATADAGVPVKPTVVSVTPQSKPLSK